MLILTPGPITDVPALTPRSHAVLSDTFVAIEPTSNQEGVLELMRHVLGSSVDHTNHTQKTAKEMEGPKVDSRDTETMLSSTQTRVRFISH